MPILPRKAALRGSLCRWRSRRRSEQFRKEPLKFDVGDTVRVHTRVVEGDKERIQVFAGIVIARRGTSVAHSCQERPGAGRVVGWFEATAPRRPMISGR